tara:strand:+ start:82 stop:423 length:342 start_codon:yes stop_codon:yes gene_type:complete
MDKRKKLSRPMLEEMVKNGEITKELFNQMVESNLVTKGRRTWQSQKVTLNNGETASMQMPRFTLITIDKDGNKKKVTVDESLYTDDMRSFMTKTAENFSEISHTVTTERVYKR